MLKDKLKEYRHTHKLTQLKFAELIGISRTYLSDLENGRAKGNLNLLLKLSSNTNTQLNDWLSDDIDQNAIEKNYNLYSVLDTFIDNLILIGGVDMTTGEISQEYISSVLNILTAEIKLKLQGKEGN